MQKSAREIVCSVEVPAEPEQVWLAWTTEEGVNSFFSPQCRVLAEPGGAYEMFFNPAAEAGQRGGEGNRLLALQPCSMLSFTWNAPPTLPEVRNQRTHVTIELEPSVTGTRLTLRHDGWGSGGQWQQAFEYFANAWGNVVLPRLVYRFTNGPIDWESLRGN